MRTEGQTEGARIFYETSLVGQNRQIGKLSNQQVDEMRNEIQSLTFPASEQAMSRLMPSNLKSVPIWILDDAPNNRDQPFGGIVEDYWLNPHAVMRVGSAYYRAGNRVEWIDFLSEKEAMDAPIRPAYGPPLGKFRIKTMPKTKK